MKKVLFLIAHPIEDAGCRYRVYQFVPYLERSGYKCYVAPFSTQRLFEALHSSGKLATKMLETISCSVRRLLHLWDLGDFDFVVIHREVFPFLTPLFEKIVLRQSRRVIFSFDDAVYAGHSDVSSLNHPLLYKFKYGRGFDTVLQHCSHVIAGNKVLAEYVRKLNSQVTIIPTVVDCNYYRYQPARERNEELVTIGWMGSRSTVAYLRLVEAALRRVADAYTGKVRFRFYGHPAYQPDLSACTSLPFRLASEIDDLHSLDIGLMPLPDTEWTRGKCAFKAIQYMASGAVAVASPVGVTTELIQHNVNGMLAASGEQWFHYISELIEDPKLRARLSARARKSVEDFYSLQAWGPRFAELFDRLSDKQLDTSSAATVPSMASACVNVTNSSQDA